MPEPTYNYLDYDGLALYDEKVKQLIDGKVAKEAGKGLSTNDYTNDEKSKLAGITAGAEPNQNAFGTVVVAGTSLAADSESDTLTITAGDNVTLTPNATSDSITIAATDTTSLADMTGVLPVYKGGTGSAAYTGDGLVLLDGDAMGVATAAQIVSEIGTTAVNRATADASGNNIAETYAKTTDVPSASPTTPKMNGTAAVGTETAYAKGDHVHPTDTSRAPVASPTFTGTPKAPTATAGTNTTQIATTEFVGTAITNAISGIQGISYQVVQSLPATGQAGVIYLLANSGTAPNIYDEYIWTGSAFEKIGTTDVDLSGYQPLMSSITNAQINALFA